MPSKAAGPRIFLSDRAMFGYFPPNTPSEAAEYGQPGRLSTGANQKSPGTAYPGLSHCRLKPSVSRRAVPLRCCIGPTDWRHTTTRAEDGQHPHRAKVRTFQCRVGIVSALWRRFSAVSTSCKAAAIALTRSFGRISRRPSTKC